MNTIPHDQETPRQLEHLAAQRRLYSDAKFLLAVHIILAVPCVTVWSFLVAGFPHLKVWSTAWGVLVTVCDFALFTPLQANCRRQAAAIQEAFDCEVLRIPWHELHAGAQPEPESVHRHALRYRRRDSDCSKLKPWYSPVVGTLPIEFARLVCQRANCWWDSNLRRRYANWNLTVFALLVLVVAVLGLKGGFKLDNLLMTIVVPLLPALVLFLRQYKDHEDAATSVGRLQSHANNIWNAALARNYLPHELALHSRDLQDEIFDHRRRTTPVFDFAYRRLRNRLEEQMNFGASTMVEEYHKVSRKGVRSSGGRFVSRHRI